MPAASESHLQTIATGWRRLVGPTLLIGSILALALGGCGQSSTHPNVIVITLDTLRADALGVYGDWCRLTPRIDAFASQSTVFENAITAIGSTLPAHATLFSGFYPRRHGVRWNGDTLAPGFTTLAEILKGEGYEAAAFVSWVSMLDRGGLRQGFSVLNDLHNRPANSVHSGDQVNRMAISWLEGRGDEPLFLWLHYSPQDSRIGARMSWSLASPRDVSEFKICVGEDRKTNLPRSPEILQSRVCPCTAKAARTWFQFTYHRPTLCWRARVTRQSTVKVRPMESKPLPLAPTSIGFHLCSA